MKIQKGIVFAVLIAISLTFTQFQTLPVFADSVYSITKITASDTEKFGWSVQRFDDGFVVGEPFAESDDSGRVHIFDPNGTPSFEISNPGGSGDNFGYSLNTFGTVLAVGAPGHDNNEGMVYTYDLTDPDSPTINISNPSDTIGARMGEDKINFLAEGDLLVGVSKAQNDGNPQAGIIYQFSSSDGSKLSEFSDPSEINAGDLFGRSISVDNGIFLTGSHGAAAEGGQAHVIGGSADVTFQNPNLISPQDDRFGWSTEITPTKYVIGAPGAEAEGSQIVSQGVLYFHHRDGSAVDILTSPDLEDVSADKEDQFGYDIAYSNGLISVGAPYDDVEIDGTTYVDAGSVYLFDEEGTHLTTVYNPDPENYDLFGYSLDILDRDLLVGAPGDNNNAGAVYIALPSREFAAKLSITADPNPVVSGAPLTIIYTITNVGTSNFLNPVTVNIVDPACPLSGSGEVIEGPFDDTGQIGILETDESWTFTCEKVAPIYDFTESVDSGQTSITFSPAIGEEDVITCLDSEFRCSSAEVDILETSLTLDISAIPDTVYTGQTSDITFTVTNEGNAPLFIDGINGIVDQNGNCVPTANVPGLITLVPQTSVDFTCTVIGETLPIDILATATALDEGENPISITKSFTVNVIAPAITLDISSNPNPTYNEEETAITYTVTNTGNAPVTIHDNVVENSGACTPITDAILPITLLENDDVIFTCTITAGLLDISLDATATATAENDSQVSDNTTLAIPIIAPAITLDISSNPNPVTSGATSLVTYTVTNTGNAPVTIHDNVVENSGACTPITDAILPITLLENDDVIFTCTITAGLLDISLDATATATDQNERQVQALAAHEITVIPNIVLSGIIRDFKISHPDFEYKIADDDGIVKTTLGADGKPLYNGNPFTGTVTTTGLVNYNQWYNHVNGINDCIQYDITLMPTTSGTFKYADDTFFPINDQLFGNEGKPNNYHFTYQIHATFVYQLGQTITMTGDDDIWVFIDNKLALDQGGVLPPRTGTINLDSLSLTEGQTYSFDLFFAERHTVQSNLGIETDIPLISSVPAQCKAVDAVNDSAFAISGPNEIDVTNNDIGASSISAFTQGMHGSVSLSGDESSLEYTPDLGFEGIDLFTYSITDTSGNTDTAVATMIVLADATCPLPVSSYNLIIGDDRNNKLVGTNSDDLILGNSGDDKIYGKKGNDCLVGGNGNDKIWGSDGNDTIISGSGNDQLQGQQGDDAMFGGNGDDKIYGSKGNDVIDAGAGNDRVNANQDNDVVTGGEGNDWLGAGIGNDIVNGGTGNDKIYGRPGNDILNGDAGDDLINAGQGDDTVNGGDNTDKIYGHQGNDVLNGNNGDDYIHGGQGNDGIDGGDGSDRCYGAQGNNTINNCEIEDKKMKEEQEENDDDEGEPENDNDDKKDKKDKKDK